MGKRTKKNEENPEQSGEELIEALRLDYGLIDVEEMFSRYRKMYRSENVAIDRIAAFTAEPTDPLLAALYRRMPEQNKYHGATNVGVNIVRRRARELSQDQHKFQPIHMVQDRKGTAHLLNGRHTAVALVLLGAESLPLVEYPSTDEHERFRVVISANETRQVGRYERVQHAVWQVTGGKAFDAERLFDEMVLKPSDKASYAAHLLIEVADPKMRTPFGGDQKVPDAINPAGLMSYLRTALGTELVDENGKRINYRTFKSTLRRAVQFLDGFYETLKVSDRFQPNQQLGPLILQAVGRFVHTLEEAGDEPAQYANVVAEYVLKYTNEIVQENATTISARLKGVVQRAKGRRE
jgi:hypothetical protein